MIAIGVVCFVIFFNLVIYHKEISSEPKKSIIGGAAVVFFFISIGLIGAGLLEMMFRYLP